MNFSTLFANAPRAPRHVARIALWALLPVVFAVGCQGADAKPQAFGPLPVRVIALAEKPVSEYDEYLASLTSRRSITLYAQVAGYVRAIQVKPGDAVKSGQLLVKIDPSQPAATLRSLAANLETKKANLAYAVQNDESSRSLVQSGLLSQLDYEQRHSQRLSVEADVKGAEAQVQGQSELLRFYSITASTDGVVGDVPVKIGDYVTPQTRLTSVDQDNLIEAYVYIPITKVSAIKPDTKITLVGDDGKVLCEQTPTFISPQVSVDTQTVLVKTVCPNSGVLRTAQVLTGRMVWARHAGLTVPTSAIMRQAGQYFVFVAERGPESVVARQRPITVGGIQDNDYVVTSGLKAGTEIVASNLQKLRDGAPIKPLEPDAGGGASPSANAAPAPGRTP